MNHTKPFAWSRAVVLLSDYSTRQSIPGLRTGCLDNVNDRGPRSKAFIEVNNLIVLINQHILLDFKLLGKKTTYIDD